MVDGVQITHEWPRPYYEPGTRTGRDQGILPVSIDGREYMVDTISGNYRRFSVDLLKTRQNRVPNENLLVEPEVWRSMVESWEQGAGQTRHDREESLQHRYFTSKNVDVWDEWGMSLLHDTGVKETVNGQHWLLTTSESLVIVDQDSVRFYRSSIGESPWTYDFAGVKPLDACSDGGNIYISLDDGTVLKVGDDLADYQAVADTFATYADLEATGTTYGNLANVVTAPTAEVFCTLPLPAEMLTYLKGFIVAGVENRLYDISLGVADDTTLIYTQPLLGHRWRAGTDGLAAGYLLGGQGDKWFAYWITVRDDAATLNPPVVAAPLPEGEIGRSLGSYLGFVLIGTEDGVRFCTPAGDNTLTYGRLIVTGGPVESFEGQDRFVWFGIGGGTRDNKDPLKQPESGLGRMDLSVFTAPLTPAFAADLIGADTGRGQQVVTHHGVRVFTDTNGDVYEEQSTFAEHGYLVEGVFNQDVRDRKIALYASISCEPLPLGCRIETQVAFDSTDYPPAQIVLGAENGVASGNIDLEGTRFEGLVPRHNLYANTDRTASPRMTRFEFRTTPVMGKAHEWQVPLLIFEGMNWENVTRSRDPYLDVEHIISLVENGRLFEYREGGQEYRCFSPGYEWRPEKLTEDEQSWQGVLTIRIREVR